MRVKITSMFTLSLMIISLLLLLVFRYICGIVLYNGAKNTLIDNVNRSVDDIEYFSEKNGDIDSKKIIEYENGYLFIDEELLENDSAVNISLYGMDNKLILGDNPISVELRTYQLVNNNIFNVENIDGKYQVYERNIILNNNSSLWIRGVLPLDGVIKQLRDITVITIYVILLVLVLSTLLSYLFARKLISPFMKIINSVSDIKGENDLKKRINIFDSSEEVNQLANTFDEMMNGIEETLDNKNKLISNMAQEIRTPLSVIITESEYMLDKQRNREEYKEALMTILKHSGYIHRLINRTIEYVNLDTKQRAYPINDIDLSSIVNDIGEEMQLLKEKNIELYLEVEEGIHIRGNRILQACLIENIISNAYKYGKENGYIKVRLFTENNKVLLEVEDNGIGIHEESLGKVFKVFNHKEHLYQQTGYGLGLSISKKIVDMHNGTINVNSIMGEGSCFRVEFNQA